MQQPRGLGFGMLCYRKSRWNKNSLLAASLKNRFAPRVQGSNSSASKTKQHPKTDFDLNDSVNLWHDPSFLAPQSVCDPNVHVNKEDDHRPLMTSGLGVPHLSNKPAGLQVGARIMGNLGNLTLR